MVSINLHRYVNLDLTYLVKIYCNFVTLHHFDLSKFAAFIELYS